MFEQTYAMRNNVIISSKHTSVVISNSRLHRGTKSEYWGMRYPPYELVKKVLKCSVPWIYLDSFITNTKTNCVFNRATKCRAVSNVFIAIPICYGYRLNVHRLQTFEAAYSQTWILSTRFRNVNMHTLSGIFAQAFFNRPFQALVNLKLSRIA